MKKFRFSLDPAVKLWERRLESEEIKLSQLQARKNGLVASMERLEKQRHEIQETAAHRVEVMAVEMITFHGWKEAVKFQLAELGRRISDCDRAIEQQRQVVQEAMRSLKTLERLKEKRFEEWRIQINTEQEQLAAELYLANLNNQDN